MIRPRSIADERLFFLVGYVKSRNLVAFNGPKVEIGNVSYRLEITTTSWFVGWERQPSRSNENSKKRQSRVFVEIHVHFPHFPLLTPLYFFDFLEFPACERRLVALQAYKSY